MHAVHDEQEFDDQPDDQRASGIEEQKRSNLLGKIFCEGNLNQPGNGQKSEDCRRQGNI